MTADQIRNEQPAVRSLARQGILASYFADASVQERRRLRIEGYELLHPVTFRYLTRRIEARRGHRDCMVSVSHLRPDCLDRFHDDMDAVLDDLFRNARQPILNLEGWVNKRLSAVTIDAHRRRRGERGALQRPRIPRWLARELNHDKRLTDLATEMLEWAGVEATAGIHDWPLEVWSAQRVSAGSEHEEAGRSVARDIATVIAAMNKRPKWYADYIERPMGHKRPPSVGNHHDGWELAHDPGQAALEAHTTDDARRAELAALAVAAIKARVERGEQLRAVVVDVISTAFGAGSGSESLDRLPGYDCDDDQWVAARLADAKSVDRIVEAVLDLLSP